MSENSPRLGLKDFLSVFLSALALLVSFATYYVTNVKVEDAVIARISDIDVVPTTPNDNITGFRHGFIVLKVAFINIGNRQAVINTPIYQLSDRPNLDNGGFGGNIDADQNAFPFVLAPKEVRLIPVKIPISNMLGNLNNGSPIPRSQPDDRIDHRRFFAGIRYVAIDSLGRLRSAWSGMQIQIDVSQNGWEGLAPVREAVSNSDGSYNATNLFDDRDLRPLATDSLLPNGVGP
jgi:hypothetical protein